MIADKKFIQAFREAHRELMGQDLLIKVLAQKYDSEITNKGLFGTFNSFKNDFTMNSGIAILTDQQKASFVVAYTDIVDRKKR